jgi:hypothetical protein
MEGTTRRGAGPAERAHREGRESVAAEPRSARLAVLIDADNASPRIADGLFEEIAKIGEASVRRIYGDFSGTRLKSWADILAKHAIIPHQNFAYTAGKNASDIALVIDAMDLLHSGRFDGFCLGSVFKPVRRVHSGRDAGRTRRRERAGMAGSAGIGRHRRLPRLTMMTV